MTKTKTKTRCALVELYVEVPSRRTYARRSEAITTAIAEDPDRERDVAAILKDPRFVDAAVVVFPGWTLCGANVSPAVLASVRDRDVVLETFRATDRKEDTATGFARETRLLRAGTQLRGPVWQRVVTADDGRDPVLATALANEIAGSIAPERCWSLPDGTRSALLICGEINLADARAGRPPSVRDPRVALALASVGVIANPAHTRENPEASRRRRRWFSRGRALLTTANIHPRFPYWRRGAQATRRQRAWFSAASTAEAYVGGQRYNRAAILRHLGGTEYSCGRHRVVVLDV